MAIITFWTRIFDFVGVSSRKEYWLGYLGNVAILGIMFAIAFGINIDLLYVILAVVILLVSIATLSAKVRRLRDSGRGWGWIFIPLVPLAGGLVLFILLLMPSEY